MSADDYTDSDLPPEVQSWLDDHPEVDAERLVEVWRLSGDVLPVMEPDPQRVSTMRDALRRTTETDRLQDDPEEGPPERDSTPSQDKDRPAKKGTRSHRWTEKVAGVIVLVLLAAMGVYYVAMPVRVTAPDGQTRTVTLADGSHVELNSGTTLRYPRWWGADVLRSWLGRSVDLEGEAFFIVTETGTSFRVETQNAEVRVLGTRFAVRSRRPNEQLETRVVVAEGRVALTAAGATAELDSAQTATVRGTSSPSPGEMVPLDRALAWRQGGFSFTKASIQTISAELARRFDVPITVRSDVQGRPVTLHVDSASGPTALLRDVCSVAGCQVDSSSSELTVRPQ